MNHVSVNSPEVLSSFELEAVLGGAAIIGTDETGF